MRTTKSHEDMLDQVEEYIKDNLPALQKKLDEMAYKMDCACELSYHVFPWVTRFYIDFIDENETSIIYHEIAVEHDLYLHFEFEVLIRL